MNAYQSFYDKYSSVADIYILYILEAHFVEKDENGNFIGGWPIGYQYNYSQHKTIDDRINMVRVLIDEYHPTIPILMDTMENEFQNAYKAWPDRACVFLNGTVKYISKLNDNGSRNTFWTDEIEQCLSF
jgi:hypothetical protein